MTHELAWKIVTVVAIACSMVFYISGRNAESFLFSVLAIFFCTVWIRHIGE